MDTPKTVWQYKTNHGPTRALIVDQEGSTIFEVVNHFKSGKRFEDLCSQICQAHNDIDEARAVLEDLLINHPRHFTPAANTLLAKLKGE